MDEKLKNLRRRFDQEFPASFTNGEKQKVLKRIRELESDRSGTNQLFSRVLSFSFMSVALLCLLTFSAIQMGMMSSGFFTNEIDRSVRKLPTTERGLVDKQEVGNAAQSREVFEMTIELDAKLETVYLMYSKSQDDSVLEGLSPLEVFKLYFHAKHLENMDVTYGLYIKGEDYGTPTAEEYYGDPAFWGGSFTKNDQLLYEQLLKVDRFEVSYPAEDTALISWLNEEGNVTGFRLIQDGNLEVWKIGWLAMQ